MGGFPSFRVHLEELIRARTPLFYIGSIEIKRCLEELKSVAARLNAETQVFSLSRGIVEGNGEKTNTDPIAILDTIMKKSRNPVSRGQTLWVLPFYHLLLQSSEALIISKLRDIIEFNRFNESVIIIGIPGFTLPPELADIPVLDSPFPGRQDIKRMLNPDLPEEEQERLLRSCMGLRLREIEDLFSRSVVREGRIDPETIECLRIERLKKRGDKLLNIEYPKENLVYVGGMEVLKEWLEWRREGFLNPMLLQRMNLPSPRGVLLTGVPGCGKSLVCKAIAGSWGIPLVRLDLSKVYSATLGSSEQHLSQCLELTCLASPCIFWIDEIEKSFSLTDSRTDGGVSGRLLGTLLNFLQERESSVFVVATSNDLSKMSPEMVRKGRWDEIFFIDLPQREERKSIFEAIFGKYKISLDMDEGLPDFSEGFSGAEIDQGVVEACYKAISRKVPVNSFCIKEALRDTIPLSVAMDDKIQALRGWALANARPAGREVKLVRKGRQVVSFRSMEATDRDSK
jgi:SpoVK/Ycf46/Vps4 family AAA+-type ATPase